MAGKPKPAFWIVVFLVVGGLIAFSLNKAGIINIDNMLNPSTENNANQASQKFSDKKIGINFYSSSAKQNWVNELVKKFNNSGAKVNGKTINVSAFHVTSGGSLDDLKDGNIKPDIWSPGDESWLYMATEYWKNVKMKVLFDDYTPLVNIPLIVAMWEPMAKALGYPNPIGWKDIEKLASDPNGWKSLGHPEWGKFRWGHAHPDANSGFLTIVSEVYAALDKTEGITPDDLKKPEVISFLKEFEGAVEHYGLSNSWIDDLMYIKGPAYLSATVQYENTIIQSNEKHQNKPFKMIAIYPKEGNFWTQHPAAILKEDWMDAEKEEACKKFIEFLLSSESQKRAMEMGLRPINNEIAMSSPFDYEHGVIQGVSNDKMFKVPDEDVLKRIRDLWEDVKIPATLVLVMDCSGSMSGDPIYNAKAGAIEFIKNMKPRDQIMVSIFSSAVNTLSDLCYIKDCGEELTSRLDSVFANGGTALYDALHFNYDFLNQISKQGQKRRYSILILSDGRDTSSRLNKHDFLDSLPKGEEFDSPKIYSIAYGSEADKELLAEISNRTNGRLFTSSSAEIRKTYKELSANF
ncbi:MAG: extracellular solute-binding protein [Desulfobacterales bacterium]|nr:extracellular solute-binding protein [Desulfobacterales bacterium]